MVVRILIKNHIPIPIVEHFSVIKLSVNSNFNSKNGGLKRYKIKWRSRSRLASDL
jgi:hypothetical protein